MSLTTLAASQFEALSQANRAFSAVYPGDRPARQPVHTVYGGAQLYKAETTQRLGELAVASFDAYAGNALELATGVGFLSAAALVGLDPVTLAERYRADPAALRRASPKGWLAQTVYERVTRQARPRSRGRFPHRLRRRLRRAPRRRRRRDRAARRDASSRARMTGSTHAALHRHPHQVVRRRMEAARRAHARALPRHAARRDAAAPARQLRGHAAQGHHPRAAAHPGPPARNPGTSPPFAGGHAALRADDRDHAGPARPGRPLALCPACSRPARGAASARTSAPTTSPPRATSPPPTRPWITRCAISPRA